ncbi:hypothetical protein FBU59_000473, partial [Linderina macrospora]
MDTAVSSGRTTPNQGEPKNVAGPAGNYAGYPYPQDMGAPREIQIVAPPPQFRRFGNAAALGLITFGMCTVQQSMLDAGMSVGYGHGTRSIAGQAIAVAGLAQFAAGLWQIANGDTFEGAAFTSFGASWLAKGLAMVPGIGVIEFQANEDPEIKRKQTAITSLSWCIWVFILLAGNVKSHVANILMFVLLNLELDLDCAGIWLNKEPVIKAGAWCGFFCGLMA